MYYLNVTEDSLAAPQSRLHDAYSPRNAGSGGGETAAHVYRRDIYPLLPPARGPVIDPVCGRRELAQMVQVDGFNAEDVDGPAGTGRPPSRRRCGRDPPGGSRHVDHRYRPAEAPQHV